MKKQMNSHEVLTFLSKLGLSALALLALASCGSQERSGITTRISAKRIAASSGTPASKAEEMAKGAEDLLSSQGFEEAHTMAGLALNQDATNLRAGFIQAVTAPLALQKGLFNRIRPLAKTSPTYERALDESATELLANKPVLANVLLATTSASDIATEAQLQGHVDAVVRAFDDLRKFVKDHRDAEITMKSTAFLVPDAVDRYADACEIRTIEDGDYELSCPSETARFNVVFNRGDFEQLRAVASYFETYFILASAYDASDVAQKMAPYAEKSVDPQTIVDMLMASQRFGRLRAENRLIGIKEIGIDLVIGLNWASANQDTLCSRGWDHPQNRVGAFFNKGFCVGPYFQPLISSIDTFLKGDLIKQKSVVNGHDLVIEHKGAKFLTDPVQDLHSLGPVRFNACGKLESLGDPTVNGILPNGDLNQILALDSLGCLPLTTSGAH